MQRNRIKADVSCPVIEADDVTEDQFFDRYVQANQPVIIRGGMQDWKSLDRWNEPGYLESVFGDREIPITEVGDGQVSSLPMSLSEFWSRVREAPNGHYCMITERPISVFRNRPAMLAEVMEDIELPRPLDRLAHTRASMFAGHDTRSPCHYHPGGEVLLCQVVGRKRVLCYSPAADQTPCLYPHPWYTNSFSSSRILFPMDGSEPDLDRFPKYSQARPIECILEPGDMLYIPIYWWHHGFCEGMSVSVGHFYTAQLRKRYMMAKGIRANLLNYRVLRYWWRKMNGTLEGHMADGGRRFEKQRVPT